MNDVCEGATHLSAPGRAFETNAGSLPSYSSDVCNIDSESRVNWFAFTPTETARYSATVKDNEFSATLALFSGTCDRLTCLGTEDQCFLVLPVFPFIAYCEFGLSWDATEGTTYNLAVGGLDGFGPRGTFALEMEQTGPASPNSQPVSAPPPPPPPPTNTQPVTAPTPQATPTNNEDPVSPPVSTPTTEGGVTNAPSKGDGGPSLAWSVLNFFSFTCTLLGMLVLV